MKLTHYVAGLHILHVSAGSRPNSTTGLPSTESSTTPFPTRAAPPSNETWVLAMVPKFTFGAVQRRGYSIGDAPPGTVAACPTERDYCIDSRFSDHGTCMHPSPETIKECLDDTCAAHPGNDAIFQEHKEDSHCKDWQQSPEGRVCHWTSDVFCSCPTFSIVYTNAVFVPIGGVAPLGYAVAEQCKYADNYKAKNKRELNDAGNAGPQGKPLQRLGPGQRNDQPGLNTNSARSVSHNLASIIIAACILVIVF